MKQCYTCSKCLKLTPHLLLNWSVESESVYTVAVFGCCVCHQQKKVKVVRKIFADYYAPGGKYQWSAGKANATERCIILVWPTTITTAGDVICAEGCILLPPSRLDSRVFGWESRAGRGEQFGTLFKSAIQKVIHSYLKITTWQTIRYVV